MNPDTLRYCNYKYLTDENVIYEMTLLLAYFANEIEPYDLSVL